MIDNTVKLKTTSFFPLRKFKGNKLVPKATTMHLAHLVEENTKRDDKVKSEDPDNIKRVTEEFIVHLARVLKGAQVGSGEEALLSLQ